jgi:hypothetical protein
MKEIRFAQATHHDGVNTLSITDSNGRIMVREITLENLYALQSSINKTISRAENNVSFEDGGGQDHV